jgi:hypothetical protein
LSDLSWAMRLDAEAMMHRQHALVLAHDGQVQFAASEWDRAQVLLYAAARAAQYPKLGPRLCRENGINPDEVR